MNSLREQPLFRPCPACQHKTPHKKESVYCEECDCDRTSVEDFYLHTPFVFPAIYSKTIIQDMASLHKIYDKNKQSDSPKKE